MANRERSHTLLRLEQARETQNDEGWNAFIQRAHLRTQTINSLHQQDSETRSAIGLPGLAAKQWRVGVKVSSMLFLTRFAMLTPIFPARDGGITRFPSFPQGLKTYGI